MGVVNEVFNSIEEAAAKLPPEAKPVLEIFAQIMAAMGPIMNKARADGHSPNQAMDALASGFVSIFGGPDMPTDHLERAARCLRNSVALLENHAAEARRREILQKFDPSKEQKQ